MEKVIRIMAVSVRSILRILLFLLICLVPSAAAVGTQFEGDRVVSAPYITLFAGLIIVLLAFFSIVRYAVLFDTEMRERYMAEHELIETFSDKLRFFGEYRKLVYSAGAVAVLYWIIPLGIWFPITPVLFGSNVSILEKLTSFPLIGAVFVAVAIRAMISAMNFWNEDVLLTRYKRFDYTYKNYLKKSLILFAAYFIGGSLFIVAANAVWTTLVLNIINFNRRSFNTLMTLLVVLVIIPFFFRNINALLKRKKFIKQLKKKCEEHRCSLSEIRHPYASLFKNYNEYNFEFEKDGKTYACKLLCSKHRLRPMTFYEEGIGANTRIIRIKKTELFRINKYFRYSFDSDLKKLLVINPIPKMLYASEKGKSELIDNGDRVREYKVYSATALVNAIDRNTLDR